MAAAVEKRKALVERATRIAIRREEAMATKTQLEIDLARHGMSPATLDADLEAARERDRVALENHLGELTRFEEMLDAAERNTTEEH